MANRVQIILEMLNRSDKAFAELLRDTKRTADGIERLSARGGVGMKALQGHAHGAAGGIAGLGRGVTGLIIKLGLLEMAVSQVGRVADRLAFDFNSKMETAGLGIATAFISGGKYIDQTTGKALEGQRALAAAQEDSKRVLEELQVANFQTIATLDQLVRAYQETLPVALAKGFDRKQVHEYTVAMVQAAGAIGLSLDQLAEETRSMLLGTINPRTSRIATVLGLRNEDIAQFKGDAQGLFAFLMEKLDAYTVAGVESQKTWRGVLSNTLDVLNQASGKAFRPLFDATKAGLTELTQSIVTIDEKTKTIRWNPEFEQGVKDFQRALDSVIGGLKTAGEGVYEHRDLVIALAQAYIGLKVSVLAYNVATAVKTQVGGFAARITAAYAERAATLAAAQAAVIHTEVMAFHTAGLLKQAQAEVLAATGMARLTAAETLLIPAQERAAAAAAAHAAAQQRLSGVVARQTVVARTAAGALGLLGGPLGLIITLLGAAATAWWVFGDKAEEAADKSKRAGESVLDDLREQVRLLKERNRIQGAAVPSAEPTDAELTRLSQLIARRKELLQIMGNWDIATSGALTAETPALKEFKAVEAEIKALKEARAEISRLTKEGGEGGGSAYRPNPPGEDADDDAAEKAAKKEFDAKVKYFNEVERMRAEEEQAQEEMTLARLRGIARLAAAERQAREEAIRARLFEIDLAERERSISREDAARARLALQRELLDLQRQHLEQLNKLDDPAGWYAQLDAINATRSALVDLQDEMQRLTGTVGEGAARGFRDFTETARTAFEDGQKLAGDGAAGAMDALDAGLFDAMKGRLQSAEDYWTLFSDVIMRSFSQILSQQAVVGILRMLGQTKEQGAAADATAVGTTAALTGAMAAQTGVVSSLTAAYWALAAAKAAAGAGGAGGGSVPVGDFGQGAAKAATIAHTGGLILHDGGPVRLAPRFHFGGLAADEVPAVLQTGERVLSRQQNRTFDKLAALLERAGSGAEGGGGAPPVIVNMNVAAMDARSFNGYVQQNREAIAQAVAGARGDNNPVARGR